jgi:hypothetical protein
MAMVELRRWWTNVVSNALSVIACAASLWGYRLVQRDRKGEKGRTRLILH